MMERIYEGGPEGLPLWYCNPELNTGCDKRVCKHNTNALAQECEATKRKEFALKIGQTAKEKAYTPGQKN